MALGFLPWHPVLGLFIFRLILHPSNILFTTDDNVGAIAIMQRAMPDSFLGSGMTQCLPA